VALIFVSYRRHDTQSATGRLCDKLQAHFGADQVFHDIESIEPGDDFTAAITSRIAASSVVLIMIGRHWLDATGPDGRSRLFDPGDYLCLEIAAALEHEIPVIPILVEGSAMPSASALPAPIVALAARQAHEITEQRWQYDSDLLVRQLEVFVPPERKVTEEDASTLWQAVLQAVAGWPADLIQLLVHPRRHLAALLKQPNFVLRAAVFFVLSHLAAAWLFVLEDFVASVPVFILQGVPVGTFILLLVVIPLHLSARAVRAPSHAPSTMVLLAYMQSMAMVLAATGIALLWSGMTFANTDFGQDVRAAFYADLPLEVRFARITDVVEATISRPVLAGLAFVMVIWLCTAGWLLVAIGAFRDMWRISRLRALAILILTAGMLSIAGAIVVLAATL
jgi:TIR domain